MNNIPNSKQGFLNLSSPENWLENIFEMQMLGSTGKTHLCGSGSFLTSSPIKKAEKLSLPNSKKQKLSNHDFGSRRVNSLIWQKNEVWCMVKLY